MSGFYYVRSGDEIVECRARGRFRLEGISPLVGDKVSFSLDMNGKGTVDSIEKRRNSFFRPAVANIDCMVILASAVNPITDPFLIDRVTAMAENAECDVIICINKTDMDSADAIYDIYRTTGYKLIRTSTVTGDGIKDLRSSISGKICVFTGNSGVGKSSLLNALSSELDIKVGEVSDKLGRGKHTTRHVELFSLGEGAYVADTPGFASFDFEKTEFIPKEKLQFCFPEFKPFLGKCRFDDCAHIKEPGCAIINAVKSGIISSSRHESYIRLFEQASKVKSWEIKQ